MILGHLASRNGSRDGQGKPGTAGRISRSERELGRLIFFFLVPAVARLSSRGVHVIERLRGPEDGAEGAMGDENGDSDAAQAGPLAR